MDSSLQELKQIELDEFVRRFKKDLDSRPDNQYCFFFGAGTSYSSGIPLAGQLVRDRWLPELKYLKTGNRDNSLDWAESLYKGIKDNPVMYYGEIIEELFDSSDQRQQEIEDIVSGRDPSFGYVVLAQLMTHEKYGSQTNIVLTTNFDDMVADALYLYTRKKPLVIAHEYMSQFARSSLSRPLVVKLHGDAQLEPKNTLSETLKIDPSMEKPITDILKGRCLIFSGYSGGDDSIIGLLSELDVVDLPKSIFWVGTNLPSNQSMLTWLKSCNAIWVKHTDFDTMMLAIKKQFGIRNPDSHRFDTLKTTYDITFEKLSNEISQELISKDESTQQFLLESLDKATIEYDWWNIELEANKYKSIDPDRANKIYLQGITDLPNNALLHSQYALFLTDYKKDFENAEKHFNLALEIEPDNTNIIVNYMNFLSVHLKDLDKAEKILEDNSFKDVQILSAYAAFMLDFRKDYKKAEELFKAAAKIDPNDYINHANYALFLVDIKKEYEVAEELYKMVLRADSWNPFTLLNYAKLMFLMNRSVEGALVLEQIPLSNSSFANRLLLIWFYRYAFTPATYPEALEEIISNIQDFECSDRWRLGDCLQIAISIGHPEPDFLTALAKVISNEQPIEVLDRYEQWQNLK